MDSGFEHLQSIISRGSAGESTFNRPLKTKTDAKFEAAQHLLLTASRLSSAANVLEEYIKEIYSDPPSRLLISRTQQMKRYIVPMISHAANSIAEISKHLAPIPSVNYVHRRLEVKRKNDVVDESSNSRLSPDLQLVCDYVAHEDRKKRGDTHEITPPKKKLRVSSRHDRRLSSDDVILPLPANGHEYRKPEVAKILSAYKKGTKKMSSTMNKMIELKYVPCGIHTLRRLLVSATECEKPVLDTDWISPGGGRPPIATLDEIKTMAESMESLQGRVWSDSDLSQALSDNHAKKMEEACLVNLSAPEFSRSSKRNYIALLSNQQNLSISQSSSQKTSTRFAAENSLRASISNLALIGSTHFIPVSSEDADIREEIQSLSEPTKMLLKRVADAWGTSVFPVLPELIVSTDDTTEYIFEGKCDKEPRFVLATKSSIMKRGSNALYRVQDNKSMSGMRVKLTFTFTAMGNCFPLVVTVTGLTEWEMNGKDFVHVEIPGLCIGGGGVSVDSSEQCGHLFLMRNTEGAEKARFKYYQEKILIPGINLQRKKYCDFDIASGTSIPDKATAVAWSDGDLSQVYAVTQSAELFTENKIIANKQNAARSGVEQPADLTPVFRIIKKIQPTHTVRDIPVDRCPMKRIISNMFHSENMSFLSLKSTKKNALIDFLSVLPEISTTACSKDNIKHGFIQAGIIDKEFNRYPVFNKILATCRQQPTLEEYKTVVESFADFLDIVNEKGHIDEDQYDIRGIRMDKDINGQDVLRTAGIAQESFQRSKCLTHFHQVNMRLERLQIIKSKETEKKATANMKHNELVEANKKVVEVICSKLLRDGILDDGAEVGEEHMKFCSMKILSELTNPQLEAFILARDTSVTKSQLPAKGKLKDAEDDTVRNRIRLAFDCRTMPNKIEGALPFDLSDQADETEADNSSFHKITLTEDSTIFPSTLLSDTAWVTYVIRLLDLETTADTTTEVTTTEKEKGDLLLIKLRERFKAHVKDRVKQAVKRNHWILKFAYKNLPIIAAAMILSKHLKLDLQCLGESECLLSSNANQFIPCLAFPRREGAYLYFDINRGVFIRSGKVVRRGFKSRHDEHLAASKEEKSSSHFYFMYPSKEGKRKEKRDKLGCFEHLTQIIGAGFDPASEPAMHVGKNYKEGGLLIMSKDDQQRIKSCLKKELKAVQKFQEVIAYLFEFGYDLALSPENNVSRSPGFESIIGIFGG